MKHCSLGFIFDATLEHVLLVHKNSPAWQAGLINGVGGKVDSDETTLDCMVRECQEETTLEIPAAAWMPVATMIDEDGVNPGLTIAVFVTKFDGAMANAQKNDHEEIEWFPHNQIPDNVISNLHFLIPLAHQKLLGHDSKEVLIRY